MVISLSSVLLALCLLFSVTADGRTMQAHFDVANIASPSISLLDSTSSGTTNSNDVEGLITLINSFPTLTEMQFPLLSKDPCYPEKLTWIECSNDAIRRVTALYLGAKNLFRLEQLPDFSSLDALQTIDLHQNSLFGPIPEFLGNFPELTYLNLANNVFSGSLPDSLANNKKIKLNLAGNPLCSTSNVCSPSTNQFSPPTPRAEFQVPPPAPRREFQFPPPTPRVEFQFPPPTPRVEFQFPPPTPRVEFQFPLPPSTRVESNFPSGGVGGGGGGGDGFGGFDLPDIGKRRKSKLPKLLGITIPSFLAVCVAIYAVYRCLRGRNADAATDVAIFCCC